jgi:hypothetical protein
MTGFEGVLLGIAGAALIWAWLTVVFIIPAASASRLRHTLWALRDEIVDDVLFGRLDDSAAAQHLLRGVEGAIRVAPQMRFITTAPLFLTQDADRVQAAANARYREMALLDEAQQDRLVDYMDRYLRACARRILIGTPSGFLFGAWIVGSVILVRALRGRRKTSSPAALCEPAEATDTIGEAFKAEAAREVPVELAVVRFEKQRGRAPAWMPHYVDA